MTFSDALPHFSSLRDIGIRDFLLIVSTKRYSLGTVLALTYPLQQLRLLNFVYNNNNLYTSVLNTG